jgi:plastocyanin
VWPAAPAPGAEARRFLGLPALAALLLTAAAPGCAGDLPPRTDPELAEALGISPLTPVHRIDLSGREGRSRALPAAVDVGPGDVVQFVVADSRVYVVRFALESLSPRQRTFLRERRQEASPPLVEPGARFVLSFADAPPGDYPYLVEGYGTPVRGRIRVLEAP